MKRKNSFLKLICLLLLMALNSSCRHHLKSKDEMIAYINDPDNGLLKEKQIGEITVSLAYRPVELLQVGTPAKQAEGENGHESKVSANKYYFILRFSLHNKELLKQLPFNQYSELVQVLSFRMADYISIIPDSAKPFKPQACVFQQTYGMSSANQLLLMFDNSALLNAKAFKIVINEFGLNVGNLNFMIKPADINAIPTIKL